MKYNSFTCMYKNIEPEIGASIRIHSKCLKNWYIWIIYILTTKTFTSFLKSPRTVSDSSCASFMNKSFICCSVNRLLVKSLIFSPLRLWLWNIKSFSLYNAYHLFKLRFHLISTQIYDHNKIWGCFNVNCQTINARIYLIRVKSIQWFHIFV